MRRHPLHLFQMALMVLSLQGCARRESPQEDETDEGYGTPKVVGSSREQRERISLPANEKILFYGKVEDQSGTAVAGATVKFSIQRRNARFLTTGVPIDFERGTVKTDRHGSFKIKGSGWSLAVTDLSSEGYVSPAANSLGGQVYHYSSNNGEYPLFSPDPKRPVVHRIWKRVEGGGAELSSTLGGQLYLSVDIHSVRFYPKQLSQGRRADADFYLMLKYEGTDILRDWILTLEANKGGFVDDDSGFGYLAPESGYVPVVVLRGADRSSNDIRLKKKYYLKARDGACYASLDLQLSFYELTRTGLGLHYRVNRNGSRVLQP